jgi:hypothetical protein
MPYNFICVQAGLMLTEMTSLDEFLTFATMLRLFALALAALVPTVVKVNIQVSDCESILRDGLRQSSFAAR